MSHAKQWQCRMEEPWQTFREQMQCSVISYQTIIREIKRKIYNMLTSLFYSEKILTDGASVCWNEGKSRPYSIIQ